MAARFVPKTSELSEPLQAEARPRDPQPRGPQRRSADGVEEGTPAGVGR